MKCVTVTLRASEVNPELSLCLPAVSPATSSCDAGQYADVKQLSSATSYSHAHRPAQRKCLTS